MKNISYILILFLRQKIPNEPLHLFITRGASTCKTFTLMLLIQGVLHFYNKHSQYNSSKIKTLFMAYTRKTTFNIDGTTIHSSLSIHFNYKKFPSLSSKHLDNLINKYDQLWLMVLDQISFVGKKDIELHQPLIIIN